MGLEQLGFEALQAVQIARLNGVGDVSGMSLHHKIEEWKLQFKLLIRVGFRQKEFKSTRDTRPGSFNQLQFEVASTQTREDDLSALPNFPATTTKGDVEVAIHGADLLGQMDASEVFLENVQNILKEAVAVNIADLLAGVLPGRELGQHARIKEGGDVLPLNLRLLELSKKENEAAGLGPPLLRLQAFDVSEFSSKLA